MFYYFFTHIKSVAHYVKALLKAYPENVFEDLLNRKFVCLENPKSVILNPKFNCTTDTYIDSLQQKLYDLEARLVKKKAPLKAKENKTVIPPKEKRKKK